MQRVGVLGSGAVGTALAAGFMKNGYDVRRGSREPAKLEGWRDAAGARASVGTFQEAAEFGELVVLAVRGTAAEGVLSLCGPQLDGKIVVDATNPIADEPPEDGVIRFFTDANDSLMERLQTKFPRAKFVKAFSCVGNALMVDPAFDGIRPTMFICGNDAAAKGVVRGVLDQFGWDTEDMGTAKAARAIEPLCILWCIPGFTQNRWTHAFKMLEK